LYWAFRNGGWPKGMPEAVPKTLAGTYYATASRNMLLYHELGRILRALEQREIPFANDEPLRLECQAFLSAMETRVPPLTDGRSGLRVLKVLQAAQRSLVMNGEPVTLPMEAFA